jgi:hypothetical protein
MRPKATQADSNRNSPPVESVCGHEQIKRVAPHVICSHVQVFVPCLCRAGSPLVLLALRDGGQLDPQIVDVRWRDLMVEGSRYLSTSDEVSRYSTVKSDLPLMVARISDLQRWTVGDSGTTQHQIPVIPMDIIVTYHWLVD